ncbi:MAG: cation diffusion facilitator family transporter [Tannerella sp.]|uniref:cation diffusion facilitator family transporter n=1 Tax=Tannerella sp. TaxID=2382127 RepID=UPI003FA28435
MSREKELKNITVWSFIGNFVLLVFKFVAGLCGRSSAMLADAVHSLSDFATDIVVFICIHISSRPIDDDHDYGHGKYETLATSVIGVVLLFVGVGIFWSGASKIYGFYVLGEPIVSPGKIALIAALVSILVKESLFQVTAAVGRRYESQTVLANAWHHRSDAFSSVATASGIAGAIWLGDSWTILDPLAAVIVSVLVVKVAIKLTVPAVNDLLEKSLPEEVETEILDTIGAVDKVQDPHHLQTRRIGNDYAIEAHIRVDGKMTVDEAHEIMSRVERRLRKKYGQGTHITLHVEPVK